ncbi:polya polymerase [Clostridium sp. AF32-12BH]|uniref:polya polymerase n=1 Tax=Clostridium sp. AF32-12BH TaxID=2292006 RepID=UPI000E4948F5|nr:polya polymerase [Clostridium sp. AF32-12BH]RHP46884.1 polya polymerase [Clostridium sp. AF32-12BH]
MKLYNIADVDAFFNVIDSCTGDVFLISNEGDKINLKSKLCQYLAMAKIFSSDYIKELSLEISDERDTEKLVSFMMSGNGSKE